MAQDGPTSLADLVAQPVLSAEQEQSGKTIWAKIAIIAALFAWMNWWQFEILWDKWDDPNWSHGFIIPLFSLYLLYARREELFSAERRVCIWGLPLVILSILVILAGVVFIGTYWVCEMGMVMLLFGLVWYLAGPKVLRFTWLPILFLAFAMPIPTMAYNMIAYPLQNLAALCSTVLLRLCGVTINVTASNMVITSISGVEHPLTVAEACSGVRSLMAYLALGVAWSYLEDRPIWQRVILVGAAIPIAIFCNVIRVTITCTMFVIDKQELGEKFMHTFTGMLMLAPALLMFWGLGKLMSSLFVEVDEESDEESSDSPLTSEGASE